MLLKMDTEQFKTVLERDEGVSLEFKKSLADSDRIGQTTCAFANTVGGQIIFGVHKQGRTAVLAGIDNVDRANQEIQNHIFNGCRPQPDYSLDTMHYDGKSFVILTINPFPLQEVCSFRKTTSKRVGSVNVDLAGEDLVNFLRERGMLSFEELPSPARLTDLDQNKIEMLIKSRGTKPKDHHPINSKTLLETLGLAATLKDFVIKKAAPLFFAKEINQFQANSEVRIVKYKGVEKSLDAKEEDVRYVETIPELLQHTFDATMKFIGKVALINIDGRRQEFFALPQEVVREAITNAIGHRDYIDPNVVLIEIFDDRIQITNPGSLLPGQTLKNFAETRRHRNPIIHRLINDFGWGEGLYFGVKSMYKFQRQNNLPDPEFQDLGGFFRVILYTMRSDKKRKPVDYVNERQSKALAYLEKHELIRTKDYAKIVGVSAVTAVKDLNELVIQSKLRKIGKFRGVYYIKV